MPLCPRGGGKGGGFVTLARAILAPARFVPLLLCMEISHMFIMDCVVHGKPRQDLVLELGDPKKGGEMIMIYFKDEMWASTINRLAE